MAHALLATYGHLPMKPLSVPSTPLRIRKHSFNLRNSDHFLFNGFTCLPATKTLSPVVRAVDKSASPSTDDKRGAKIFKRAVGASLALACAIGVFNCSCNLTPNAIAGPKEKFKKAPSSIAAIQVLGGKYALNSLLEVTTNLTSDKVKSLKDSTFKLPPNPSTEDIRKLKMEAVRLIKSGNMNKAMEILYKAYSYCLKSHPEQAQEVDMTIVEILISQGNYTEALKRNCLTGDESPGPRTDPRFALYKGIVHTMLDNKIEAKKWWSEYYDTIGEGFDPSGPSM